MNYGALFTTLGWVIITALYSYYISHFANYTMFYGSISTIIVMMIWIYFLSFVLVMGIAINSNVYNNTKKYNLITTIGSDFHKKDGIHKEIGLIDDLVLPDEELEKIISNLKKK